MKCKWYAEFEGVCTNGECPYRGDVCPASEHPEVCKYCNKPVKKLSVGNIVEGLRMCSGGASCHGCPAQNLSTADCSKALKEQAADMLEKLAAEKDAKKPEWISVKDRLPEKDIAVLACIDKGQYRTPMISCVSYYGEWITLKKTEKVTHWMPLPEPPKEVFS